MPPRPLSVMIVFFWLSATTWLVVRDLRPHWRQGEPPAVVVDLTDELSVADTAAGDLQAGRFSTDAISWKLWYQDKPFGSALTQVLRHSDRTFELWSRLDFVWKEGPPLEKIHRWEIPLLGLEISSLTSSYRVTARGDLKSLRLVLVFKEQRGLLRLGHAGEEIRLGLEAEVVGNQLVPHLYRYAEDLRGEPGGYRRLQEFPVPWQAVPVPERGAVLNTLQPLHRLTGLHAGQTWQVPHVDPLETILAALVPGQAQAPHYLQAQVIEDQWPMLHPPVPCWRIDYTETGRKLRARTWVRQRDGLVLQQEAYYQGASMVLRRWLIP